MPAALVQLPAVRGEWRSEVTILRLLATATAEKSSRGAATPCLGSIQAAAHFHAFPVLKVVSAIAAITTSMLRLLGNTVQSRELI